MAKRLMLCLLALLRFSSAHHDFAGKEFAFSFMQNYGSTGPDARFSMTIVAQQHTKVKVQVPSLNFLKEKFLEADQSVVVTLPVKVEMKNTNKFDVTVLVTATSDVTINAMNYKERTSDTALVLPINMWGTEYFVFTPYARGGTGEFSVTNGKENNRVEIHLKKGHVMYGNRRYVAGQSLVVDLGPYETLQLQSSEDLTGSRISSQKPVGVLCGHVCMAGFTKSCDHVFTSLLPVNSWGSNYMVPPMSFQTHYDSIYIQASQPTKVTIMNKKGSKVESLTAGGSLEVQYHFPDAVTIKADQAVQVLMLFNGAKLHGGRIYDNFLMRIPPMKELCSSYSIVTQPGFQNMAMLVAPTAKREEVLIDGNPLKNAHWRDIPHTEYSYYEFGLIPNPVRVLSSPGFSFAAYGFGAAFKTAFGAPAQCRRPAVKAGVCWAQGDPHYSTFDGRRFDFMGTCTYLIAKNCEENTQLPFFEISAKNEHRGNTRVSYMGLVTVKIAGYTITAIASEIGRVRVDNNRWSLPLTLDEGKLQLFHSGRMLVILTDFGLLVRYDWKSYLVVTLPSSFIGKTCGLCGNFNGDPKDDFATPEGRQAVGVAAFGSSWKVPGLVKDDKCSDDCVGGCKSCTKGQLKKWEKDSSCGLMTMKKNGPFSECHAAVDPVPYMNNCAFDLCMNEGLTYFLCKSLEAYAESCQDAGIQLRDWRKRAKCPYKCQANSEYQQCGRACPATCADPEPKCTLPCVETCVCKRGFVLVDGRCQSAENCGCTHKGRYLAPGKSFWADDRCRKRCTCNANSRTVECKDVACKTGTQCQVLKGIKDCHPVSVGRCRATGDPHYVTFDKKKFDFMGTCVYQMVKHPLGSELEPFEVLVQNDHRGSKVVSYTKMVQVKVYSLSVVITRTYKGLVMVNGELANLPLSLAEGRLSVYKSGRYAVVSTTFGLKVSYDWERALFVNVPSTYMEQVSGLCGNFNGKAEDDLIPKNAAAVVSQKEFGASWLVEKVPGCVDGCQGNCPSCDITQKRRYEKGTFCGILKDPKGAFRDCHAKVDPADYFEDCVFDVCLFKGRKEVLCQAITSYTSACQAAGANVHSWRTSQNCEMKCPANSRYETCAAACPANCQADLASLGCDEPCSEGCACEEGFILSGERCVPVSECGCVYGDRYYTLQQIFYPDGKCDQECKCHANGQVECKKFVCSPNEECQVKNGKRKCQAVGQGLCQRGGDAHYRTFDGRAFDLKGACSYTLSQTNLVNGTHLVAFAVRVENNDLKNPMSFPKTRLKRSLDFKIQPEIKSIVLNRQKRHGKMGMPMGPKMRGNMGMPMRPKTHGNMGMPMPQKMQVDMGMPMPQKMQANMGITMRQKMKANMGMPMPQKTRGNMGMPMPQKMQANMGITMRQKMKANTGMPMRQKTRGNMGMPMSPKMKANTGMPMRPKMQVDMGMPMPQKMQANMGITMRQKMKANTGMPMRQKTRGNMGMPMSPKMKANTGMPMRPKMQVDMGMPMPQKMQANMGITMRQKMKANTGMPMRQKTRGNMGMPMSQKMKANTGMPMRQKTRGNMGMPMPPKMQVDMGMPMPPKMQVDMGMPMPQKMQANMGITMRQKKQENMGMPQNRPDKMAKPLTVTVPQEEAKPSTVAIPQQQAKPSTVAVTLEEEKPLKVAVPQQEEKPSTVAVAQREEKPSTVAVPQVEEKPLTVAAPQQEEKPLMPATTKGVALDVYGYTLNMRNTMSGVLVNGIRYNLPLNLNNGAVTVYRKGAYYIMATDFGLRLTFDQTYLVTLTVPGNYQGQTSGLCGNFNGNPNDDLQRRDRAITEDLNVFAGSWKVKSPGAKCEPGCSGNDCLKCSKPAYSKGCDPIMDSLIFRDCRAKVDHKVFYDNCAVDSCASKGDVKSVCENMAAFAFRCNLAGINVDWRTDSFCPMQCPANSHYEACSDNCAVACPGLRGVLECPTGCMEGCTCDEGFVFNGQNCVPISECGCYENGKTYKPNEVAYLDDCKQRCLCRAGNGLFCDAYTCPADFECLVKKGLRSCYHKDPCQMTSCTTQERCVVEDGEGICIPMPTGTCWAWGDPHYRTFDGYSYEFQGACRYVYSMTCGDLGGLEPYSISERNGNQGHNDASNLKEIALSVHGFNITARKNAAGQVLVNGEPVNIPLLLNDGEVKITYKSGSPLIVTDFGLQVWFVWDWKVVVLLPRTYEGKVCGLCGNFNRNRNDERQLPDGSQVSTVEAWGKGWMSPEQAGSPCQNRND